jgi:hypothetical protein
MDKDFDILDWLKSKQIWGALLTVIGYLTQPQVLDVLPKDVGAVISAVGVVLFAIGNRSKQNKLENKVDENTAITLDKGSKK